MTMTPTELDELDEARALLDAVRAGTGLLLNQMQTQRALLELDVALAALRKKWRAQGLARDAER